MAEYIDRELLLKDLETSIVVSGRNNVAPLELRGVHKVIDRIKSAPTEDVVPVVRCNDCKHSFVNEYHEEKPLICCMTMMCGTVKPDYYCWQGEGKCDDARDFV